MTKAASPRRGRHPASIPPTPPTPPIRPSGHPPIRSSGHPVILRAVAGSTHADNVVSGVDSATSRGTTGQRGRCRSSITTRNACASTRNSRQARRRVSRPAAGSVAASKARRCPNQLKIWRKYLVPTAWVNRRCGGRVLGETQHRDVEGIAGTTTKLPSAAHRYARTNFKRTPAESGRSGRIQGARAESSQVHASRAAARAADLREAFNPGRRGSRSRAR